MAADGNDTRSRPDEARRPISLILTARSMQPRPEGLLRRLEAVGDRHDLDIVVQVVERGAGKPRRLLEALRGARHEVVVVMDADRDHPPEAIPALLDALRDDCELAIASRYTTGGGDAGDRAPLRWLGRRLTRLLARPLSSLRDPTSSFVAVKRSALEQVRELDSTGRGLGLELMVKGHCARAAEVPVQLGSPTAGREPFGVVTHVRRLYMHRFGVWADLVQFAVVGASGTVVNLGCLTLLVSYGVDNHVAIGAAIAVSMFTNFLLNRRFTFAGARLQPFFRQLAGFCAACSLGALVNYVVAALLHNELMPEAPIQIPALLGIIAGTALNFVVNRYLVFRAPQAPDPTEPGAASRS